MLPLRLSQPAWDAAEHTLFDQSTMVEGFFNVTANRQLTNATHKGVLQKELALINSYFVLF